MPITEKATIKSHCTFSKDRKHKFLLTLEWEEKKPKAVVIMSSPAEASCIVTDLTTSLVIKNLYQLGYGGCDLVNLGSKLNYNKLIVDKDEEAYNKENREIILKCVADENNEKAIIAWGSCGAGNQRIQKYQKLVLDMLADYKEKLYVIQDERGKKGVHPLTPSVRNHWTLVKFEEPHSEESKQEKSKPDKSKSQEKLDESKQGKNKPEESKSKEAVKE